MSKEKGLLPTRRFPEFRDKGEWEEKFIRDLGEIITGSTPSTTKPEYYGGDRLFVSPADISDQRFIEKTKTTLTELGFSETRPVKPGSILFVCIGSTIGKIAQNHHECATNQQINAVVPSANYANAFVYYSLENNSEKISGLAGNHAVPIINKTAFGAVEIRFPKLPEQQKIADFLSSVDELIAAQTQKLDALKTHKKGLMQQLFPAEGETVPKRRFPEFRDKGEWELKPLSALVKSLDAGVSVNSGDRPANKDESGILKTSAVTGGIFDPAENKIVTDIEELRRLKEPVLKNTIIISRMNTPSLVGANAYIEASHENLFLPDRLWAAKPKLGTSMRFIAYILGGGQGRAALSALATGTSGSMKNISKSAVLEIQVLTPSAEEQKKIADCLTSIDELITTQTQKLESLKSHKKGLMQQLFPAMDAGGTSPRMDEGRATQDAKAEVSA